VREYLPKQYQIGFNRPATFTMGDMIDLHHSIAFYMVLISVFVTWMLFFIILTTHPLIENYYIFREPSKIIHNTSLEIVWTIIPCIILFTIAVPSFSLLYQMDDIGEIDLTVKVIGNQWYWNYELTDAIGTYEIEQRIFSGDIEVIEKVGADLFFKQFPRLYAVDKAIIVPTNINIRFLVTSNDVLHSWALPAAGIKIDACPGRLNEVFTNIPFKSILYGQCSEICGINHAFMPIEVLASPDPIWWERNFLDNKSVEYTKGVSADELLTRINFKKMFAIN